MMLLSKEIEEVSAKIGRSCGDCTLCCTLLAVDALSKPARVPCQHECKPSPPVRTPTGERVKIGGCGIYKDRPQACRDFTCAWLVNKSIPDYWYPHLSRMLIDFSVPKVGPPVMRIHVHPDSAMRWREEPFASDVAKWTRWADAKKLRLAILSGSVVELVHSEMNSSN